jgi:hypothetical protein
MLAVTRAGGVFLKKKKGPTLTARGHPYLAFRSPFVIFTFAVILTKMALLKAAIGTVDSE